MTGIIDVGGGMRDIYGAGVFDRLLDDKIEIDKVVGISAGSANAISYTAGQRGRNFRFYTEYSFRKEYMSLENFVKDGSYVDLNYIYGTLSNAGGEDPVDYEHMKNSKSELFVIATNALTGEAVSFKTEDMSETDYFPLMASSCLPVVGKPVFKDGVPYFDGGMSDPVPVDMLLNMGCDKIILVLTKPKSELRHAGKDFYAAEVLKHTYPNAADGLYRRYRRYNTGVLKAMYLEKEGKALILSPDSCEGVDTLKRNKESLEALYKKGYNDAEAVKAFLEK